MATTHLQLQFSFEILIGWLLALGYVASKLLPSILFWDPPLRIWIMAYCYAVPRPPSILFWDLPVALACLGF